MAVFRINRDAINLADFGEYPARLAAVSERQLVTALVAILMTIILIAGLRFRPKRFHRLSWCNLALIVLFFLGAYFSFTPA